MNKIICEVCGTAYPDTSYQCPICGCAKPVDDNAQSNQLPEQEVDNGYSYVKGGRFSKSNVRKRNNMAKPAAIYDEDDLEEDEAPKENNRGLTIAIILLLLAIVAVAAYIYIRFFAPARGVDKPKLTTTPVITTTAPTTTPQATTTAPETTPEVTTPAPTTTNLSCTGITLANQSIVFDQIGGSWQITATVEPANTPDQIIYSSANPKVATIDATGRITAIGNGTTTITVTCGSVSTQCSVTVQVPEKDDSLRFNTGDPFLGILTEGHGFRIRLFDKDDTNKTSLEVTDWTSSKPGVATVDKDGVIVAKSQGTTVISCIYKGWKYECTIIVQSES